MLHTIGYHCGSNVLTGDLHTILACLFSDSTKERLVLQFLDGLADIAQYQVAIIQGCTSHDGQYRLDVVATTTLELISEGGTPVLAATLPGVNVHILDDVMVWTLHKLSKPVVYLLLDSLARELVALQSLGTAGSSVGMTSRCISHTDHTIGATYQVQVHHVALHLGLGNLVDIDTVFGAYILCWGVRCDTPYKT